jgi:hypothetical protein
VLYREGEVLPAGVWNFMPLLFSRIDIHKAAVLLTRNHSGFR